MAAADKYLAGQPTASKPAQAAPAGGEDMLGVPDGYSVPPTLGDWFRPERQVFAGGNLVGATSTFPQYPEGAEQRIRNLSVENLARLQGQLATVGLIGPETRFRVGVPDSTTITAYKRLLEVANNYAISDSEALDMLARTPSMLGGDVTLDEDGNPIMAAEEGPTRTVNKTITEPTFTDPLTARAIVREAMQARLGRAPTADEYQDFRKLLSNSEAGQDVTTTVTTTDGKGHSKTRVKHSDDTTDPSADVLADQFTRKGKLGREANTVQAASFMDVIARRVGL